MAMTAERIAQIEQEAREVGRAQLLDELDTDAQQLYAIANRLCAAIRGLPDWNDEPEQFSRQLERVFDVREQAELELFLIRKRWTNERDKESSD